MPTTTTNPVVDDPEMLEALYWQEGLTIHQIAERLDVSRSTIHSKMVKYGIDTRGKNYHKQGLTDSPFRFYTINGYERMRHSYRNEQERFYVHQLVLIADGADPHKVFSKKYVTHHKNRIKFDNRPSNLELVSQSEHAEIHKEDREYGIEKKGGREKKYSDQDLIDWIDSFVEHFGFVPAARDIRGWPGPSEIVYSQRFGSWTEAIKEAGYKPRSVVEE